MIFIALAFLLYLVALYSCFAWSDVIAVILFSAHCILMLVSFFLEYSKRLNGEDTIKSLNEEIENLKKVPDEPVRIFDTKKEEEAVSETPAEPIIIHDSVVKLVSNFIPHAVTEPAKDDVDIVEIAKDTADELSKLGEQKGIRFQIVSANERVYVRADKENLRILFRNIIDNSIKYMQRAGILTITISTIDDDIFIVCKDNGLGLDSEETTHIFELNYQGSNRISGNGLGLAQAKAIVDAYGGTIYARSRHNQGMGIYIQIPASGEATPEPVVEVTTGEVSEGIGGDFK